MAQIGGVENVGALQLGTFVKAMADANQTLTGAQAENAILVTTGALTATRDLILPAVSGLDGRIYWLVNTCTGGSVRIIGPTGTGITVATVKAASVYCDGTNIVRLTADA